MQGQFIFSTCNRASVNLTALLRNTARESIDGAAGTAKSDMRVSLNVFHAGALEYECADFATVPADGFAEVSARTCPILKDDTRELLLLARCQRGQGDGYFPQEHQVIYESRQDGRTTSLLYDQLPVLSGTPKTNSILLLAPKVWISVDIDTFITLANVGSYANGRSTGSSWRIDFLAQSGEMIHSVSADLVQNGSHVIDVKESLAGRLDLTGEPRMLTVVARGETAMCVILTFVRNHRTRALALEHSLSPHYYMNGDFARVRKEAFMLTNGARGMG
jgi:hypothetical protein